MSKLEFKAELKKQLTLKGWNYGDLAKVTGYSQQSIQTMMCDDAKLSQPAMKKFAEVLNIPEYFLSAE